LAIQRVELVHYCGTSRSAGDRVGLHLPRDHPIQPQAIVAAYFEPRYNVTKDLQYYVGIAGESISFPNRAAAEIDLYGGFGPTFGPLALDFGGWYYWYPGGHASITSQPSALIASKTEPCRSTLTSSRRT
jgi:Bacterial protein of unknown function (Gcw_chp)